MRKTIIHKNIVDTSRLSRVFYALGDPGRYQTFSLLVNEKGLCVSHIAHILGVSASAVSQQFRILEMTGLVRPRRIGQNMCYEIRRDDPLTRSLVRLIKTQ